MPKFVVLATVGFVLISAAAAAQIHAPTDKMMHGTTASANDPASTKAFKEAHTRMMKAMNVEFSGNADVDFVRTMIPHHQGAIDMAKIELAQGKDSVLRKMAEKMISDQEKEIEEMRAWLKKNAP